MATLSQLYIAWNNALVDYFISTSTSTVFYVTDSKINDIGKKYNIEKKEDETYNHCFIRSINFVDYSSNAKPNSKGRICYSKLRNELFSQLHIHGYTSPSGGKSKDYLLSKEFGKNNATTLDFAVFLTKHKIFLDVHCNKELLYPYFSYVIFVLLGFNQSKNREWKGVKNIFDENKMYFSNNDREKVAVLFNHLITQDKVLTPSCIQTQDPYIKYLKYHSVLKPCDKSLFDEILYRHHIKWDTHMVYGDIRNLIWRVGIRSIRQHDKLREALLDADTRPYFESLIKDFDREEYARHVASEANVGNKNTSITGCFRYIVDCMSHSSQIWLQYIKPNCAVSSNGITLTPIYIYPDNFRVDVQPKDRIAWSNYVIQGISYKDSNYSVKSRSSDLYFFEIIEGRILAEMIEPEQLAGKACYLIVNSNKIDKQNVIDHHHAIQVNIKQLVVFDGNWEAYYIPQYVPKQAEIEMRLNQTNQSLRYAQVCFDNCVTIDRKTYLLEAFPYIVTEGIDDPSQEVGINISDISDINVPFKKKIIGNRIYLYDFGIVDCGEIKVKIIVDGIEDCRSYRVASNIQVPLANNKPCARFDKWGCLNNSLQTEYYSDNEVIPSKPISYVINNYTPNYIKGEKRPYHRLMSILYALGNNTARDYTFSSTDLDNVLNYLADFEGETLTLKEIKILRYALRDLGILTHYYNEGKYVYETNTPRLVPLLEGRSSICNGQAISSRELYLLYGAYSQSMYDQLYDTVDHIEYKPLELSQKLNRYIPPYIVVGLCHNQIIDSIQKCNTPFLENLMDFAGKVSELEFDEKVFRKYSYVDNETLEYPIMVPSNREHGRKELLRLSANYVIDNDELSPDLLRTYIRFKHNEPIWYVDDERRKNSELYFRSDWQLPFYVRKALVAKNYALPRYLYAFGMEGIFGFEKPFCKMYMYRCEAKNKLRAILGNVHSCHFMSSSIEAVGLKMLAIKSEENKITKWQLKLYMNEQLLCYTKLDISKVFYCYNGKYTEVISDNNGNKTINAKLSAVLNLHIHCATSKFDINEWVKDYLCVNSQIVDTPSQGVGEIYEVKIMKPITKNDIEYAKK